MSNWLKILKETQQEIKGYIDTEVQEIIDALNDGTSGLQALRNAVDNVGTTTTGIEADIGTLVNTGGIATLGDILGDVVGESVADRLIALNSDAQNIKGAGFNTSLHSLEALRGAIDALDAGAIQPSLAISSTVTTTETSLFDKQTAGHIYTLEHFRIKIAHPGTDSMTIRLYEEVNDILVVVDQFVIDSSNYNHAHSLMDMFGIDNIQGEKIKITGTMSGGPGVSATGQAVYADATL